MGAHTFTYVLPVCATCMCYLYVLPVALLGCVYADVHYHGVHTRCSHHKQPVHQHTHTVHTVVGLCYFSGLKRC